MNLSHLDQHGAAQMVDISAKSPTLRTATASACVTMNNDAWQALITTTAKKGDVLATARLAGIIAAKNTANMIPLCHPLPLEKVTVHFDTENEGSLAITTTVQTSGKTGVEMEALCAASIAALTVYDMLKAIDKAMIITHTRLVHKSGGQSGDFHATA